MTLSQFSSTETLRDPGDIDKPVISSPKVTPCDEKDVSVSTTPAELSDVESQATESPPYHVFTRSRKLWIVIIVSFAAIFSPLSSNIYFPALTDVSNVSWLEQHIWPLFANGNIGTQHLHVSGYINSHGIYDCPRSCPELLGFFLRCIGPSYAFHRNIWCIHCCEHCSGRLCQLW